MTGRDQRSVGELLLDADHTARDILMDAGDGDAAAMARTWAEVVQTASTLWSALPVTPSAASPNRRHATADPMAQVWAMTAGRHRGNNGSSGRWPGPGLTDPWLQDIADTFARATELIDRHRGRGPRTSGDPAVRADADAARTRIIHTLYLTAHGVRLAVVQYTRSVEAATKHRRTLRPPGGLSAPRSFLSRLDAVEQVTGAYVARTYPAALAGEHRQVPSGSRIATALAAWDVHAHRAVATNPTAGHLRLVARTQELILAHAAVLLSAAAHTGAIDSFQYASRLEQPLEAARVAWAATGRAWAWFAAHGARPDSPVLADAAAEVRAALREITLEGPTRATAEVIAARTDLPATARSLATMLSTSADLAHLVHDVTADPSVTFPARAVNAAAMAASTTATGRAVPGSGDAAQVAIKDLTMNRQVPLTPVVQARETHRAEHLKAANQATANAGAWLTSSPAPTPPREPVAAPQRSRAPQPVTARAAVPGCAR